MRKEAIFNLLLMIVLSPLNDQILDPTRDLNVAISIHFGFITRKHPDFPLGIGDHRFRGLRWGIPIFFHDEVAAHGQFASLAHGEDFAAGMGGIHNFGRNVREEATDAVDAFFDRVVRGRHGGYGARFRHAVADGQFGQVEDPVQFSHQLGWDAGAGGDAGAEVFEAGVGYGAVLEELEFGEEHGWDAVEGGAFFLLHALEGGEGVEGFGWENDGGAVGGGGHVAEYAAEAVEEGRGTADDVVFCEEHPVADAFAVVQD